VKYTHLSILILVFWANAACHAQTYSLQIAKVKYKGGGDWYANPTSLPNLAKFCNRNLNMSINPQDANVEIGSPEVFNYAYLHITGHGNMVFSAEEARNLRNYLTAGGFLHISDNYGLNEFARREMKKVFPELEFIELPYSHPIYSQTYTFANGLPKIHEHDNKSPQGFGLVYAGRLVCFYDYECDLGDGWEDADVHSDPENIRTKALQMGANILQFAFTQ
jgi:hypothetical protein